MPVTKVKSLWSSGNLIFRESVLGNDSQIHFGVDDDGLDVKLFGTTSGANALWDESADKLIFDKADIQLGDTDFVQFGDASGGDVSVNWTSALLQISPAANDTGSINIGNGTADIDFKVFLGASNYVLFDVGNTKLTAIAPVTVGADDAGHDVTLYGATTGCSCVWDESEDQLVVTGPADVPALKLAGAGTFSAAAYAAYGTAWADGATPAFIADQKYLILDYAGTLVRIPVWANS